MAPMAYSQQVLSYYDLDLTIGTILDIKGLLLLNLLMVQTAVAADMLLLLTHMPHIRRGSCSSVATSR